MASNSVNILLSARDEASPAINKAAKSSDHLSESMKGTSSAGAGAGMSMKGMVGPLALIAGGFLAAKAAAAVAKMAFQAFTNNLSASLDAWAVQEEAMRGNSQELQDYASDLQALTNIGDEVILNAMQMARGMGVAEEDMKGVTQTAIALSEITGKDLNASMKMAAKGSEGYIEALEAVFPEMRSMSTLAEKQAFANEKLGNSYAMAQQGTDTLGGALTSLGNNWGDMLEKVGQLLAPFIQKIADWFNRISPIIQKVIAKALPMMQNFAAKMQEVAAWIGEKLVYAFTFIEQAVLNWQQVMAVAGLFVYGKILKFVEDVRHFFTGVIPGLIKWFADNWMNIFRDMFVAYITMWKNRIQQVVDLVTLFWDAITGKIGAGEAMLKVGEIAGRNLLEGFKATTQPLPDLLKRQMTVEEKSIAAAQKAIGTNFMDKVDKKYEERIKGFKDTFKMELGGDAGEWEGVDFASGKKDDDKKDEKKEGKKELGGMKASEGRLLSRGRQTSAQQALQKQDKMNALLKKIEDAVKRAAEALEDEKEEEPPVELTI